MTSGIPNGWGKGHKQGQTTMLQAQQQETQDAKIENQIDAQTENLAKVVGGRFITTPQPVFGTIQQTNSESTQDTTRTQQNASSTTQKTNAKGKQ